MLHIETENMIFYGNFQILNYSCKKNEIIGSTRNMIGLRGWLVEVAFVADLHNRST